MDARAGDESAERKTQQRRLAELPAAAAHVPGPVSGAPPRSHLLCGPRGDRGDRAATDAAVTRRVRSSAARGGRADRIAPAAMPARKRVSAQRARYQRAGVGPCEK